MCREAFVEKLKKHHIKQHRNISHISSTSTSVNQDKNIRHISSIGISSHYSERRQVSVLQCGVLRATEAMGGSAGLTKAAYYFGLMTGS